MKTQDDDLFNEEEFNKVFDDLIFKFTKCILEFYKGIPEHYFNSISKEDQNIKAFILATKCAKYLIEETPRVTINEGID